MHVFITDFDKSPSTIELGKISCKIAYMWKRVGVMLGLETCHLNAIQKNHPNSCEDACLDMLIKWKELNINVSLGVLNQAIEYCQAAITKGIV